MGEQSIGGLAMNGGTLIFDTDIPAATLAEGYISVDTLVVARVTTPGKAVTIR